jgi:hypothetical protein
MTLHFSQGPTPLVKIHCCGVFVSELHSAEMPKLLAATDPLPYNSGLEGIPPKRLI